MKKTMSQTKVRVIFAIVTVVALVGLLHQWRTSSEGLVVYVLAFALLYSVLTIFLLWLIFALQGWMKLFATLMAILTAIVAGWDILAVALIGSVR